MARVTVYLPDALHRRWREELEYVNLSRLTSRALLELLDAKGEEVVFLCDLCRSRVGLPATTKGK